MKQLNNPWLCAKRWLWLPFLVLLAGVGLLSETAPSFVPVWAAPADLFLSEYVEGSSNNKALEIFNGTGASLDLAAAGYAVQIYANGNTAPSATIPLTGTVAAGDVYVLADEDADPAILAQADQTSGVSFFNGNDAVALLKNGAFLDVLGQIGADPGSGGWGSGSTRTANHTLRRRSTIESGDPDGSDPFHPAQEWDGFPQDSFAGLGSHALGPPPPPVSAGAVIINEAAWGGTAASSADEWLELLNTSTQTLTLDGWVITSTGGLNLALDGLTVPPGGYLLIERTDDQAVSDVPAALTASFGSGLSNGGDALFLSAAGALIDTANGDGGPWPAGSGSPDYRSMERIDPLQPDSDANWAANDGQTRHGLDKDGQPLNGTPGQPNSTQAPPPPLAVIINEVAWGGTAASPNDEWLELHNPGSQPWDLAGWTLTGQVDGQPLAVTLSGVISPGGYLLLERQDDETVSDIPAGLIYPFGHGLDNGGESLQLRAPDGTLIDTANGDGGPWPAGSGTPDYRSMERIDPLQPDSDANWAANDGQTRNGLDSAGQPLNGTPGRRNAANLPPPLLISEFLYDGLTPSTEGDEFVELCNPNADPLDLTGYKVGDEEQAGGGESMYLLPAGLVLQPAGCLVIAKDEADFTARFGQPPDLAVADLSKYPTWGSGSWSLSNTGDELLVLGPDDEILDSVAYRNGDYAGLGLEPDASAPEPDSLQRVWPTDTASMPHDFVRAEPTPGHLTAPPPPPAGPPPAAPLGDGMFGFWGDLHAHTSYSDGAGPPHYALALARAAGLHFYALTDHGWWLTEAEWTRTLSQTEAATEPGAFVALRGLEWSHATAGHANIFNSATLLQRTHPLYATLSDFYTWLAANPQAIAQFNHPDPSYGGTFHDFAYHPAAAQQLFLQEIGNNAQQYTTYEPSFVQANALGWRVAPTNNSDVHSAEWGLAHPARTGLVAPALTPQAVLEALRARRVFATEDSNLALALRLDGAWMGQTLTATGSLPLSVTAVDFDAEPLTLFLYDRNLLLATAALSGTTASWETTVEALPGHYFWAKAVQADGDTAYTAPVWLAGQAPTDALVINELLPAPNDDDWDGDGLADHTDEWIELYNPLDRPVGLGGWRLRDSSNVTYHIPLGLAVPPGGFAVLYQAQTGIALNNGGDSLTLLDPTGAAIDTVSYDHSPGYDEAWCRLPDGQNDWSPDCAPTPNEPNWERPPAGPLSVSIYEAKQLAHNAWVEVRGQVTAPPGVLAARTMYIQDESAGIMIYLPRNHGLFFNVGDYVEVEGDRRTFRGEFEIAVDEPGDVSFKGAGSPVPPLPLETTNMLEPYEGRLVLLRGQAVRFRGRTRLWLDDGSDPAQVYIRTSTGIRKPFLEPGAWVTAVGVVSQYSGDEPTRHDYRLLPRYQTDLIFPEPPPPPVPDWPTLLPETGRR